MSFEDFDQLIEEFMGEFGGVAYIIKQTTGAYNPATGSAAVTTTTIEVEAIMLDYPLKRDGLGSDLGTLIQVADKVLYVRPTEKVDANESPLDIDPTKDRVSMAGKEYKIVVAKELNTSGSDSVYFELYLKR